MQEFETLTHPRHCVHCARLRAKWLRTITFPVLTWCRICGMPVLLELNYDYDYAKRNLHVYDSQPQSHGNVHAERDGWGVHWRFDEVLSALFGNLHQETCWPTPPWATANEDYQQAMDMPVRVLSYGEAKEYSRMREDVSRRMLDVWINRRPRSTREELRAMLHQDHVWTTEEAVRDFEILGFRKPFAIVVERATGRRGSMLFQDNPRFFFSFDPERVI